MTNIRNKKYYSEYWCKLKKETTGILLSVWVFTSDSDIKNKQNKKPMIWFTTYIVLN